jgi:protein PhnA
VYLEDDVRAWAESGLQGGGDAGEEPVDSNGTVLSEGDSVTLIKDLDVKGTGFTAKRGTLVKNIHLGDDPTHIEGRVNKTAIMLKTCFLKRVS